MHGNGNDFIVVNEMKGTVIPDEMKAEFAEIYCRRRFAIGADGVIFIMRSKEADVRMRLFQPDGSEAEMCGNGARCLAKYVYDNNLADTKLFTAETIAGVKTIRCGYKYGDEFFASVDMGKAEEFRTDKIGDADVYSCRVGVPHAVIFADDIDNIDIEKTAPSIRHAGIFAEGANVNYVQITGSSEIKIRTFERGVEGETLSCGTGSAASAYISSKVGKVSGDVIQVETKGGSLSIKIGDSLLMSGTAYTVFDGSISF